MFYGGFPYIVVDGPEYSKEIDDVRDHRGLVVAMGREYLGAPGPQCRAFNDVAPLSFLGRNAPPPLSLFVCNRSCGCHHVLSCPSLLEYST